MRKLNPNASMLGRICPGEFEFELMREKAPIESARPNIRSERDSILAFGIPNPLSFANHMQAFQTRYNHSDSNSLELQTWRF